MSFWKSGPFDTMSFGFEAELLVTVPRGLFPRNVAQGSDERPTLYRFVTDTLQGAGLPANTNSPSFNEWQATFDSSIRETPSWSTDDPEKAGVELISPVFLRADMGQARADIQTVFSALGKKFGRLSVNSSCGLHVHVGSQGGSIAEYFHTVKNVALLLVAFEHLFNSLLPHQRVHSGRSLALPPSRVRAAWMPGLTLPDHLELLMQAESVGKVVDAMNPRDRFGQTNMRNLLDRYGIYKPRTIEFRHFAGSVDPALIGHVADLWLSLTAFAHAARPTEIDALLRRAYDRKFTVFDLFTAIGCPHLREPFLPSWRPQSDQDGELPWDPRWWEPEVLERSAKALEQLKRPPLPLQGLDKFYDDYGQKIVELEDGSSFSFF